MRLGLQCGQVPPSEWLVDIVTWKKRSTECATDFVRRTWGINDATARNIVTGIFGVAIGDKELVVTMPDGWHWQVEENESE